jgi:hypothetical protein
LLRWSRVDEIFLEEALRARIHIGQTGEKTLAFLVEKPIGDDVIDEFVDPDVFRSGRIGGREEQFGHCGYSCVLMRGENFQRGNSGKSSVNFAKGSENIFRKDGRERGRENQEFENFAAIQDASPEEIERIIRGTERKWKKVFVSQTRREEWN